MSESSGSGASNNNNNNNNDHHHHHHHHHHDHDHDHRPHMYHHIYTVTVGISPGNGGDDDDFFNGDGANTTHMHAPFVFHYPARTEDGGDGDTDGAPRPATAGGAFTMPLFSDMNKPRASERAIRRLKQVDHDMLESNARNCSICFDAYDDPKAKEAEDPDISVPDAKQRREDDDPDVSEPALEAMNVDDAEDPPESVPENNENTAEDGGMPPLPDDHRAVEMPCGHQFGASCLEQWLKDSNTCPMCRTAIESHNEFLRRTGRPPESSSFPFASLFGNAFINPILERLQENVRGRRNGQETRNGASREGDDDPPESAPEENEAGTGTGSGNGTGTGTGNGSGNGTENDNGNFQRFQYNPETNTMSFLLYDSRIDGANNGGASGGNNVLRVFNPGQTANQNPNPNPNATVNADNATRHDTTNDQNDTTNNPVGGNNEGRNANTSRHTFLNRPEMERLVSSLRNATNSPPAAGYFFGFATGNRNNNNNNNSSNSSNGTSTPPAATARSRPELNRSTANRGESRHHPYASSTSSTPASPSTLTAPAAELNDNGRTHNTGGLIDRRDLQCAALPMRICVATGGADRDVHTDELIRLGCGHGYHENCLRMAMRAHGDADIPNLDTVPQQDGGTREVWCMRCRRYRDVVN